MFLLFVIFHESLYYLLPKRTVKDSSIFKEHFLPFDMNSHLHNNMDHSGGSSGGHSKMPGMCKMNVRRIK